MSSADQQQEELRGLLADRRLAGRVRTTREQSLRYIEQTLTGDTNYTFGLQDWQTATFDELLAATEKVAGDLLTEGDPSQGWIEPDRVIEGIHRHAEALRGPLRHGGAAVLIATGHPMGLLEHYAEIARALQQADNLILKPLDDARLDAATGEHAEGESGIRFIAGVGCAFVDEAILHTHRPDYMAAMLAELGDRGCDVDLVIADHGMAGAAIEAGVETLSIADVNDSALMLAQQRGRHRDLLCIEDNFTPARFTPVTEAILRIASG